MNVLQSIKDHATHNPDIPFSISEVAFLLGYIKGNEKLREENVQLREENKLIHTLLNLACRVQHDEELDDYRIKKVLDKVKGQTE